MPNLSRRQLILAGVLLLFGALSFGVALRESPTCDEPYHLTVGYLYWKTGRYDFDPKHTPLIRLWASLPLIARDVASSGPSPIAETVIDRHRVITSDGDINAGRFMIVVLSVLLGLILWRWAFEAFGEEEAWISLAAFVFCPPMLEFSHLITTDMGMAVFSTLALYAAWRYARAPNRFNAAAAGLAMGLAMMAKLTSWMLVPLCLGLAATEIDRSALPGKTTEEKYFLPAGIFLLAAASVVLLCYRVVELPSLFAGVQDLRQHLQVDIPHFFHGRYNESGGWPWFMTMVFLLKTPIPFLLMTGAGLCLLVAKRYEKARFACLWLLLPALMTLASSSFVNSQFGIRRILLMYPLLCLFIGETWTSLRKIRRSWMLPAAVLGLWYAGSTLYYFPRYLSYFNESVGGPGQGYRYLVDCNLDWGQGLKSLGRYLEEQGVHKVYLSYFGTADPHKYGIKYLPFAPSGPYGNFTDGPEGIRKEKKVLFVISATNLAGLYYKDHHSFDWLKDRKPAAVLLDSIFVYDITKDADAHERMADMYQAAALPDDARRERLWARDLTKS